MKQPNPAQQQPLLSKVYATSETGIMRQNSENHSLPATNEAQESPVGRRSIEIVIPAEHIRVWELRGRQNAEQSDGDDGWTGSHKDKKTPPATPPQIPEAGCPGPLASIDHTSLGSASSNSPGHSHRGRDVSPGVSTATPKRAASKELERRPRPSSPQENASNPRKYGLHGARAPARQSQRQKPRVYLDIHHYTTANDIIKTAISIVNIHKQGVARDSSHETMPPKQNTLQQPLAKPVIPKQRPPRLQELPKGVVRQKDPGVPVVVDSRYPDLYMQPESSPISQDQLTAEVKGIYGGLVMVEAKCINIDAAQAADPDSKLGPEQWQALIALHRTLLYEHHDFLMATQHPSATPALTGLAQKYSMPARMWRHGIHAFLEVLRPRRPQSQDYMLSFIYLAYQMMYLLYETVPTFTDTWIECLGDLARYRMAIEEEKEAHTIWGGVAARWYRLGSNKHPTIGRLYHHLGTLERPSLRKLFLYAKSLSCVIPFPNARDSLRALCGPIIQDNEKTLCEPVVQAKGKTLCEPNIQAKEKTTHSMAPAEATIVTYHAYVFSGSDSVILNNLSSEILSQLDNLASAKIKDISVSLLVTNIAALFEQGSPSNRLCITFNQSISASIYASRPSAVAFPPSNKSNESQSDPWPVEGTAAKDSVYDFCYASFWHIMHRGKDRRSLGDVLPAVHTTLVWLRSVHTVQSGVNPLDNTISSLFERFAWGELCEVLNLLIEYDPINARTFEWAERAIFPGSEDQEKVRPRPLSEDYLIRGLIWSHSYFPPDWFSRQGEDDQRFFETPAMHGTRIERVQWLGLILAQRTEYMSFDVSKKCFLPSVKPALSPSISMQSDSESEGWVVVKNQKSRMRLHYVLNN